MEFRTETQILFEMLDDANSIGLIPVSEETMQTIKDGRLTQNQYVLDLATHSKPLGIVEDKERELYENINLDLASGEALDRLAKRNGIVRYPAKPATVDLNISIGASSETDIFVPAGTLVLLDEVVGDEEQYVTSEDFTLYAGTTEGTVRAESVYYGFRTTLPAQVVNGLNGFSILTVTNTYAGINGVDLEEDEHLRQRVMMKEASRIVGTKEMIENYLNFYEGIDSYKLVPRYDGVGTLKIVADTLATELDTISEKVYEECMLITDYPPLVVLPTDVTMAELTVTVTYADDLGILSKDEVNTLIQAQVKTFVEGGTDRNGNNVRGMSIGEDFVPSKLIAYLVEMIPEVKHFVLSATSVTTVDDTKWFRITSVVVSESA